MLRTLRNAFLTGIILLLPLGVTYIVATFLVEKVGVPASRIFFWYLDDDFRNRHIIDPLLSTASLLVVVVLITFLGILSRYVAGRIFFTAMEKVLDRLPFINTVYRTVKQIVDTFSQQQKAVFQEVVLVEYPRADCYVIGFLTSESKGEPQHRTGSKLLNIFVPTTPNPTSGFLLMIPEEDVMFLSMSVAEGMKLIISGGAVTPSYDPARAKPITRGRIEVTPGEAIPPPADGQ